MTFIVADALKCLFMMEDHQKQMVVDLVNLLVHANICGNCEDKSCISYKKDIDHAKICKLWNVCPENCPQNICQRFSIVLAYHAHICQQENCNIYGCTKTKIDIRNLQKSVVDNDAEDELTEKLAALNFKI